MAKPTGVKLDIQTGTDRTMFATWTWNKKNTKNYKVRWYYATGDGVAFVGNDSETEYKQSTYSAPSNATSVKVIIRPIAKTRKVNGKDTAYWTASWSTAKVFYLKNSPPSTPSAPKVEIKDYKLTASLDNLNVNATHIQFQVIKDDSKVFKTGTSAIKTSSSSFSCTVTAGSEYKVRCRSYRRKEYSPWSEYSENKGTKPSAPKSITSLKAISESSVSINWNTVKNATSYEVEYTSQKRYFDSSNEVQSVTVDSVVSHAEITGLETGDEHFFRVRAINSEGESAWTAIKSIVLGKPPSAPTTWSSSTKVKIGEPLTLYWVHNTVDGSSQTYADLEMYVNGNKETYTIQNSTNEDEKDKTSKYVINTSEYHEGTKIEWRVRTSGITKKYGEWSVQRTIDIYEPPTLSINVTDSEGEVLETIESFPFYIEGTATPDTQKPIGYVVSITANEGYETIDNMGNPQVVSKNGEVYSKYYDTEEEMLLELLPGNINLENNVTYTVKATVTMDSGLNAEATTEFSVAWTDEEYEPDLEIGIDSETLTASLRPYCEDEEGNLIEGVSLSVYRREFDGTFTELGTDIYNLSNTYITDPHPALDYARYRVVAVSDTTGAVSFYDVPGYPVGEKAVVIQWDEQWSTFDAIDEDELEEPSWSGSMLKLPYNIDVSDSHNSDVALVEYIGRKHPVSYYGTQLGETSTWNVEIDKSDEETLYALRRLAIWMGDVYVREPSGSGYWASISVSFSQKHCEVTIPVTLSINRVAGGA